MSDLHDKARAMLATMKGCDCDWCELVADLLAENERLAKIVDTANATIATFADRAEAAEAAVAVERKRGDAVIVAIRSLRDVCTTPGESKADFVDRIKAVLGTDPDARVEALYAAEARLLALCEAEPVAVIHADGYWTHPAGQDPFDHYKTNATRLEVIPRPSMEGKTNG